jgi:hypothetical protein
MRFGRELLVVVTFYMYQQVGTRRVRLWASSPMISRERSPQ